ncbi:hypothetical protein PBI_KALPINE_55 [Mycobacterium phage Kalpine]|nr:hypothetical protein PBI_KALPINE_55 [Mycobacterium phage Kalpine]
MSILTTAEEIINGQRALDYGDAKENHERIATLWGAYKRGVEFSPEDVAVMMILLKIARFMENGYHNDTVVDIAGYAGVLEKMQLPPEQRYRRKPREWESIFDIPSGVTVTDVDGDTLYFNEEGKCRYYNTDGAFYDRTSQQGFSPYKEVV